MSPAYSGTVSARLGEGYDLDNGQAGIIVPRQTVLGAVSASAASVLVANRKYAVRFVPSRDMRIISVGFCTHQIEGSAGNSAMDCGIFSGDGQTLLASSGALTGIVNGTGWHHLALTVAYTVRANVTYYAALATASSFTGAAATIIGYFPGTSGGQPFGTDNGLLEIGIQASAGGTLAAPLAATSSSAMVPVFCLRET